MGQRVRVAEPLEKRCVGAIVGFVNWRKGQEKRKGTVFPSLVCFLIIEPAVRVLLIYRLEMGGL